MDRSSLKDIGLYKRRLAEAFLGSEAICRALMDSRYSQEAASSLMYAQIFPWLSLDEEETAVLPFLLFDVDVKEGYSSTVKQLCITVEACCHKDCMDYALEGFAGNRADILADLAERAIRGCESFGIGCLHLDSSTHKAYHGKYYGRQIVFSVPDFRMKG